MGICNLVNTSLCLLESIFCKILYNKTTVGQHSCIRSFLQKPFPITSSAPGRQVSTQEPCSQEGARFSAGVQVHTREPACHQRSRFTPGNYVLAREWDSHQESRFSLGNQVHTGDLCSEKCFDVLKALAIPILHSNLHFTEPKYTQLPLPTFSNVCPVTAEIFFFKGKENKHSDILGI